jgi:hypothetical protein
MNVLADERGLIGKLLVLWLVVLGLVVVGVIDAGSIALARFRTGELARDAGSAAAERLEETGKRRAAIRAATAVIAEGGEAARLLDLEIAGDEVTVVVADRAGTLLAGRFGFLDEFTNVTASDTATGAFEGSGRR